jgi:hypothetical protein
MRFASLIGAILALVFLTSETAHAGPVTIDMASAKAVLDALARPALDSREALAAAQMPGNQGLIRKANTYHIPATTQTFVDALVAAARGASLDTLTAKYLGFDRLKSKAGDLRGLIAKIESQPESFEAWVVARVGTFSPPGSAGQIEGYLVVGGSSGGFAFGEPRFYLNLDYFNEFEPAKVVLAHELYHAVQAAHSVEPDDVWLKPESPTPQGRAHQQMCAGLSGLLSNLYQEGSASYVGDPMLLDEASGPFAAKTRAEMRDGLKLLGNHATLLELSVVGLQAKTPVPYDDIYAIDFYIPEPLYKLGYAMAKAIALDEGPQKLATYLDQPGYRFTQHYLTLPLYGKDREHPKLGPNTIAAAELLASGCKAPAIAR